MSSPEGSGLKHLPDRFYESLPKSDDRRTQLRQRHRVFTSMSALPKQKEALFDLVVESPFHWVPCPVRVPGRASEAVRIYTIGFRDAFVDSGHDDHPEICLVGRIPCLVGRDLLDAIYKLVPIRVGELEVSFGYSASSRKTVTLRFDVMDPKEARGQMPECWDFYRLYYDTDSFKVLVAVLPAEFVRQYDPKYLDEVAGEASVSKPEAPPLGLSVCWGCKKAESEVGALKICRRCGKAAYCSRDCQVKDWKAGHSKTCRK